MSELTRVQCPLRVSKSRVSPKNSHLFPSNLSPPKSNISVGFKGLLIKVAFTRADGLATVTNGSLEDATVFETLLYE